MSSIQVRSGLASSSSTREAIWESRNARKTVDAAVAVNLNGKPGRNNRLASNERRKGLRKNR